MVLFGVLVGLGWVCGSLFLWKQRSAALHLVLEFAGVRFVLPFWVVRPLFYGNNAPLRYALYWSSREADYASGELQ
ncbi:hypothetical protein Y345_11940 [Listeria monocytogenes]|nr:hypothetical protein [Listeria monocytogenes]